MKRTLIPMIILLIPINSNACDSLENLSWLLGEWKSFSRQKDTLESWKKISDVTFEGIATTKSKQEFRTIHSETLRIVEMGGEIFYIAKVKHNLLPIAFKLTKCLNNTAVFENQNHDFPKKIHYSLEKKNKMNTHITGNPGENFSIFLQNKTANNAP